MSPGPDRADRPSPPDEWRRVAAAVADRERFVSATISGARRGAHPPAERVTLRPVELRAGLHLQVSTFDGDTTDVANVAFDAASDRVIDLLGSGYASMYVRTLDGDLQLRHSKKGAPHVTRHRPSTDHVDTSHDRRKLRLLDPEAPFLTAVGVDRAKRRQVERFLEILTHTWPDEWGPPLRVVDLGCGSGVLTMATHHLLREVAPGSTTLGIDTKAALMERLTGVVADLGWDDIELRVGTIADADLGPRAPDLVLALHACDTATDDALARAIEADARVILAAPCCQHDLQAQLDRAPPGLDPLVRHGIVRERLGDLLTDTLRAEILRAHGYRTDVIEFVSTEHTAKNLLIRAVRRDRRDPVDADAGATAARELAAAWGVEPALARRVGFGGPDPPG